jgi:hypothetical protein
MNKLTILTAVLAVGALFAGLAVKNAEADRYDPGTVKTKGSGGSASVITADTTVSSSYSVIESFIVVFDGATAGEAVGIKNGSSSGADLLKITAQAADAVYIATGLNIKAANGIYAYEDAGGTTTISIGYTQ